MVLVIIVRWVCVGFWCELCIRIWLTVRIGADIEETFSSGYCFGFRVGVYVQVVHRWVYVMSVLFSIRACIDMHV